ncbi:glutamine-hydrolyzing carbamoyl-phosphate synthase small subunit [candidate division KSB1 bacterium]
MMNRKARLLLADGTIFNGLSLGAEGTATGEVVFNTAMTGYQEILTDPSYRFQIIVMTYPQIGNYGVNKDDFESSGIFASGLVIREQSPVVSHWKADKSLDEYLKHHNIAGISDIDTRALTRHIRDCGAQMGMITTDDAPEQGLLAGLRSGTTLVGRDIVKEVTTDVQYEWTLNSSNARLKSSYPPRVAVYDFGVKYSILRQLRHYGCSIRIFPATTPAETVMDWNPDGIFLSNGPGDPGPLDYAVDSVRKLLGKIPIFGICLGHQILGLALGGTTEKLKFGHHGANHPVKYLPNGSIEITSQNHGFIVNAGSLPENDIEITHINLNDGTLEGFRHRSLSAFSVQYHPESAPGPHDSRYLFDHFIDEMKLFHAKEKRS